MNSKDWLNFRQTLMNWYRPERRPMPWKEEKNPYFIWLSEIILQQTRVEQGMGYFERFKAAYPTVEELAAAPDGEVMKLWEGLGYYSRARNLLKAARKVVQDFDGHFPNHHAGLLSLPGVGPYTAAAIGSFAFDLPLPVVDGNVYRVLSRFAGEGEPIDTTRGKKRFNELASLAFDRDQPARYNQAIMDFGAMVCTPKAASCKSCPLNENCRAYAEDRVYNLPVKIKKLKRRTRYFHFLVIKGNDGSVWIQKRTEKDIWQDLHQFVLIETEQADVIAADLPLSPNWPTWLSPVDLDFISSSPPYKQQLTHQEIIGRFHKFESKSDDFKPPENFLKIAEAQLSKHAFPKLITRYLAEKSLYLDLF